MRKTATSWATCLRILCAVALVFVGLSHAPVSASPLSPAEVAAYTLPDGTVPDICVNDAIAGHEKHVAGTSCEACRIGSAMLLPLPADAGGIAEPRGFVSAPLPVDAVAARSFERPGAPPRAPPVLPV